MKDKYHQIAKKWRFNHWTSGKKWKNSWGKTLRTFRRYARRKPEKLASNAGITFMIPWTTPGHESYLTPGENGMTLLSHCRVFAVNAKTIAFVWPTCWLHWGVRAPADGLNGIKPAMTRLWRDTWLYFDYCMFCQALWTETLRSCSLSGQLRSKRLILTQIHQVPDVHQAHQLSQSGVKRCLVTINVMCKTSALFCLHVRWRAGIHEPVFTHIIKTTTTTG